MRKRVFIYLILIGLFLISSACAEEKFFEIKAKKFSYTPNIIEVDKGDTVSIRLISEDVQHGFFIDGYGIETSAYPGQQGFLKFVADKRGRYSFRCSVTCGEFHPFMVGYLVVKPNTRFHIYIFLTIIVATVSLSFLMFRKKREGEDG